MRNRFIRALTAAFVTSLIVLSGTASAEPAPGAPVLVAASRCNDNTINDASSQIRGFDRHGAGNSLSDLQDRFAEIAQIITVLSEEHEILANVCSTDAEQAPLFAELAATIAWALVLESELVARLDASCPAAAKASPTMMLADAWLSLANVVNNNGGKVPAALNEVIPKVQAHAAAAGMTLPPWADTSAYWRDQIRNQAKAAVDTCPSPSPGASPAPSPT